MSMRKAPVLFVSHGSPMFALEPGRLGPLLAERGRGLDGVTAVLVLSAHWHTRGVRVGTASAPETIHDFGGFPAPLYQLQYRPPGQPALAADAARLLVQAGFPVTLDTARGLDHGAWVPLSHLLPDARLPVFQVSLPGDLDAAGALRLGQALAPLRERGVLIVGSGSLTHNLYEVRQAISDPEYARQFVDWVRAAVEKHDLPALLDYRRRAPQAQRAHPSEEHFLPLLCALGASSQDDALEVLDGGMSHGVLSMQSYAWSST